MQSVILIQQQEQYSKNRLTFLVDDYAAAQTLDATSLEVTQSEKSVTKVNCYYLVIDNYLCIFLYELFILLFNCSSMFR